MSIRRSLRALVIALTALALSAGIAAANQSSWALGNATARMANGLQVAGTHVTAPAAGQAMTNAATRAQSGLARATSNAGTHVPDDVVSLAGTHRPTTAGKPTKPTADANATSPLDALTNAGEAAHAGLTKAGDAITSNPTSSDDPAWSGLNKASAAIDAGLAKAAQAVGTHH